MSKVRYNEKEYTKTAAPVQLLNLGGDGNDSQIQYNEAVIKSLFLDSKLADRKVVVFSIIGAFRKGKSYIMNYVLRYMYAHYKSLGNHNLINEDDWLGDGNEPLTGFDWKAGTNRITTGLIMWSDVFLYDDPNGDKLAIYLMDTQGLFDPQSTSVDNSRIFSLSTMISSIQILNLLNLIQEDQLQYLQFATEYARYASSDDDKSPFQKLLILIRDWNSPEEYKYGLRDGNAFLNKFLEIHDSQKSELQSVRRYVRSSFEKIDCFLMAHPGKTVARDAAYDGRWSQIDEDFVGCMNDLFEHLFSPKKLTMKKINGVPVNPAELLIFISTYVDNFKNDNMPEATNIYESTLEKQFRILVGKSVDVYINSVAAHDDELQSEDDINKLHVSVKEKALKFFNEQKKFGSFSEGAAFKRELQKKIEEVFKQWKLVSMTYILKLQEQRLKTEHQIQKVQQAQVLDSKAKNTLAQAIKNAEEAKALLAQARFDTEEARREAKELAERSRKADLDRADAIAKEQETRIWLEKMRTEKEFFEKEYNTYKHKAIIQVGHSLGNSQRENGFLCVLRAVSSFLVEVVPVFHSITKLFG